MPPYAKPRVCRCLGRLIENLWARRFEGAIQANKGQAFFLVFCTALSFATLALVLQIQFPAVGNYWFLLTLLSPYA